MNAISQYKNVQILTADRVRLVVMLYDGIIRFNKLAEKAMGEGDAKARGNYVSRSLAIIEELSGSLDMENGGEVAQQLSRLYEFATFHLVEANVKNDRASVAAVTRIMQELKAGWEAVASDGRVSAGGARMAGGAGHGA